MSILLTERMMRAPSVQQFLEVLVGDLAARRSLFVLLPAYVDHHKFSQTLEIKLLEREFRIENVWLPRCASDTQPVSALGGALQVVWPSPTASRTVANLIAAPGLPDIICLDGLEELPTDARAQWLAFVEHWAQASQNLADRGSISPARVMHYCSGNSNCRPHVREQPVLIRAMVAGIPVSARNATPLPTREL
jgi:hypothetical protein